MKHINIHLDVYTLNQSFLHFLKHFFKNYLYIKLCRNTEICFPYLGLFSFLISLVMLLFKNNPHQQFDETHCPNYPKFQFKSGCSWCSIIFSAQLKQTSSVVQIPRWHFKLFPKLHCIILAICNCGRGAWEEVGPISVKWKINFSWITVNHFH